MTTTIRTGSLIVSFLLVSQSVLWLGGCSDPSETKPPNIVLISIDTLRADRLGSYGWAADTSPVLDHLAANGVRFENSISHSSWTLPSHMSLFTSQLVSSHGIVNEKTALPESELTLAEVLSQHGYRSTAFATWVYLNPAFGFGQGFSEYYLQLDPQQLSLATGSGADDAREVVDAVENWLTATDDEPFFLFVHLFDPHLDYAPPAPYDQLFTSEYDGPMDGSYLAARAQILGLHRTIPPIDPRDRDYLDGLYQGEIRFVDDQIGRLLDAIDSRSPLEETLVIVLGDHGEEIGDHGSLEGHGWTLYEEVLRVPLILGFPDGGHRGTVIQQPVGLIDVAPTVLDYLDIETPKSFQGRSLLPLIESGSTSMVLPPVISDSGGRLGVFKRSVRGPRYKLIESKDTGQWHEGPPFGAGFELYDLETDPQEQNNLYHPEHPEAQKLLRVLEMVDLGQTGADQLSTDAVELSEEERKMLESLGYIQ
jgi:arylsulfatase A-like enzyme